MMEKSLRLRRRSRSDKVKSMRLEALGNEVDKIESSILVDEPESKSAIRRDDDDKHGDDDDDHAVKVVVELSDLNVSSGKI